MRYATDRWKQLRKNSQVFGAIVETHAIAAIVEAHALARLFY